MENLQIKPSPFRLPNVSLKLTNIVGRLGKEHIVCNRYKQVVHPTMRKCFYSRQRSVHLYWIVSDVVEARSLVIRIRTMLKRKMKLICGEIKHITLSLVLKVSVVLIMQEIVSEGWYLNLFLRLIESNKVEHCLLFYCISILMISLSSLKIARLGV